MNKRVRKFVSEIFREAAELVLTLDDCCGAIEDAFYRLTSNQYYECPDEECWEAFDTALAVFSFLYAPGNEHLDRFAFWWLRITRSFGDSDSRALALLFAAEFFEENYEC